MGNMFTYSVRHPDADEDRYQQDTDYDTAGGVNGLSGVKDLYFLIENWVRQGQPDTAVEFLMANGFDRRTALSQVAAVRQAVQEARKRR